MIRKNERSTLAGFLFFSALLLIVVPNFLLPTYTRRLDYEPSDPVDQLSELYKLAFDEDVSEEFGEIQKQVRIRSKCEAHPDLDTSFEGFVGTDHLDSYLTTISCVPVHYRIPTSSIQGVENSMVFGILSSGPQGRARRDSIRRTWGQGNTIFFVVGGDWENIEEEYNDIRDILWIDQPEEYRNEVSKTSPRKGALTFKSETFLVAMYDQVAKKNPSVEYFFKTDDDCYVDVHYLEQQISSENEKKPVDYWGQCNENKKPFRYSKTRWYVSYSDYPYAYYPKYCIGAGYVLSSKFLECAVGEGHVEKVPYMTHEDGAVGLLAERCDIEPPMGWLSIDLNMNYDSKLNRSDDLKTNIAVQHNVKLEDMDVLHEHALPRDVPISLHQN